MVRATILPPSPHTSLGRPDQMLRRSALLLAAALIVAAASYVFAAAPATSVPPAGPLGTGDSSDSSGLLPLEERIAFWSARVGRDPGDFLSMVQLALLDAELARRDSDLAAYERADGLLTQALVLDPTHLPALRAKAAVRFSLHDFAGAAQVAEEVLRTTADDPAALATLADATLELGDLDAARVHYGRLAKLAQGPAVDARLGRLAFLTGDEPAALRSARAARDGVATASLEDPAFYHYQLAELARLTGDAELAASEYRAGLALRPNDVRLLLGAARLDASQGRTPEAIAGLRQATAIVPQPEALALLGDLLAATGDRAGADAAYATVRAIERLTSAAGTVYDRQVALFELDHDGASADLLARLQAGLKVRHDAYGHDLVAWALYRSGDARAAAAEIELALSGGVRDPRLLYHAGAIALANADRVLAKDRLEAALARATGLTPAEIADARALLESAR